MRFKCSANCVTIGCATSIGQLRLKKPLTWLERPLAFFRHSWKGCDLSADVNQKLYMSPQLSSS